MGPPEVSVNINIIIQVNHFNYLGLFTHMKAHHEPQYIKMMEQQELILNLRREKAERKKGYNDKTVQLKLFRTLCFRPLCRLCLPSPGKGVICAN